MKPSILTVLLFLVVHKTIAEETDSEKYMKLIDAAVSEKWMDLPLDHFNLFDNRTWKMRYHTFERYYQKGGPLFIEVGGEWTISKFGLLQGQLPKLAAEHHGLLVQTEHRYYGQSLPFENFTTENLKYLQMEQALEDLAYFIEHLKMLRPELKGSKVIVHGCSYPGMLVTWMRLRFPHVVDIAYASSAPLGVGMEYPEYYEVVSDTYANVSSGCFRTIKEGFKEMLDLAKTRDGRETIRDTLKDWNCDDITDMEISNIHGAMMGVLNVMHDPAKYEELACLIMAMDKDETTAFERLAKFVTVKSKDIASCKSEEPSPEDVRTSKAWTYQLCTEQGTFLTLDRDNTRNPFAVDLTIDESVEDCRRQFGDRVTADVLKDGIERTIRRYGGKRPLVSRVVTVQGTHDPWKHLASLEDYNSEAPVIVVDGSHCIDHSEGDDDPIELLQARRKIRKTISKWIKQISKQ